MTRKSYLGESTTLPEEARRMLMEAAAQRNSIVLDNTIEEVKRRWPQFFKQEKPTNQKE